MIVPMSRVEIVCLNSIRPEMVNSLQRRGLLHVEEMPLDVKEAPEFLNRVRLGGPEYDAFVRMEDIERTLNEIAPLLAVDPGREAVNAALSNVKKWPMESWGGKIADWANGLREPTRQKATLQDAISVLENYKRILEDVSPALGGKTVKLGKGTRAVVLTGDVKKSVARLDQRVKEELGPEASFHRKLEKKRVVGLLTFPPHKGEEASRLLSQEGVTPVDMRDDAFEGATVGEVITRIETKLKEHRAMVEQLEAQIAKYSAKVGAELMAVKALVGDELARLRVQGQFAESKMVTVIRGWTPTEFYKDLDKALEREFAGQAVVTELDHHDVDHGNIPTQLKNHRWFKPFEVVLSLFRPPTYGTLDPTTLVAISFVFFYGFILGDVGYGLVVLLFANWFGKKWGHIHPAIQSASTIGRYMGWSGIVFGAIYGEYFGDLGERVAEAMGFELPLIFHRAHENIQLLIYAILVGVVHIPLAMILGIRESLRHGHAMHAVEKTGMLFGLFALMIGACAYFGLAPFNSQPMLILAAALFGVGVVMIFIAMKWMGLVGVLEIMSLGSNVLSYARLMALGVAAIAIAGIANDLPGDVGYLIGIPAAILIHFLNIVLSVASPTIHSLRLNFVEFLPKFYNPAGKYFSPFRKETSW